jgi:HPt (histidine-containing phosphotransfer) domain-containing protein
MKHIDQTVVEKMRFFLGDRTNDVLQAFITSSEQHAQKIRDAFVANDTEALRHSTHALKGSSGTIGAMRVMAISKELEIFLRAGQAIPQEKIEELLQEISDANQDLDQIVSHT